MKEKIKKIKEMSKDPRKKALLQLGAWFLFFFLSYIIIILIPRPTPQYHSSNSNKGNTNSSYSTWKNFEYVYTFMYQEKEEQIKGTYFDEKYYFTYLGNEYYSTLTNVYKVDSIKKQLSLERNFFLSLSVKELEPITIKNMIDSSTKREEKEYKDGKKITSYEYTQDENSIFITTTEQNKEMVEVLLDYQNTYPTFAGLKIKLEYQEVNNLSSYSKNYLDYQVLTEGEENVHNQNGF